MVEWSRSSLGKIPVAREIQEYCRTKSHKMMSLLLYLLSWPLYILQCLVTLLGWLVFSIMVTRVALGPKKLDEVRKKIFAYQMAGIYQGELEVVLKQVKDDLFSSLKTMKSTDPDLKGKGALNILEVGVGGGANLSYYPRGSRLYSIDPNPAFESYFNKNCEKTSDHLADVKFTLGRGEDMRGIADASVDAVVVTLVLCGVQHLDSVLNEVKRVLVPGGKFFFLEHTGDSDGTTRRRIQDVLSNSGIWPAIYDGCHLNRRVQQDIHAAGFSEVSMQEVAVQKETGKALPVATHGSSGFFLNPIIYGVATK